jgi:hypothetical protein
MLYQKDCWRAHYSIDACASMYKIKKPPKQCSLEGFFNMLRY